MKGSAPEHCHTDGRGGSSQFLVERSEWQHSSPGELKVGGIVYGKPEADPQGSAYPSKRRNQFAGQS